MTDITCNSAKRTGFGRWLRPLALTLAGALAAQMLPAIPATAQNTIDQFEIGFQTRETQRRATVSQAMGFSEAEALAFWPIYDGYRTRVKAFQLRRLQLVQRFTQHAVGLEPEEARVIMHAAMALDREQQAAKEDYFALLGEQFEGARYFRLYQLEVKLDAIFRAGWTAEIPFAITEEERDALQMQQISAQQQAPVGPLT